MPKLNKTTQRDVGGLAVKCASVISMQIPPKTSDTAVNARRFGSTAISSDVIVLQSRCICRRVDDT